MCLIQRFISEIYRSTDFKSPNLPLLLSVMHDKKNKANFKTELDKCKILFKRWNIAEITYINLESGLEIDKKD